VKKNLLVCLFGLLVLLAVAAVSAHQSPKQISLAACVPSISFTSVPAYGSFNNLRGRVSCVNTATHKIAVYILVGQTWWTKSYWHAPLTPIKADGTFETDVTTGGIDEQATQIAAFVVRSTFKPPLCGLVLCRTIPQTVCSNSIARRNVTRRGATQPIC
jgi:hypothetical protein